MSINLVIRFLGLVVLLNVVRYVIGGPIEGFTIMEPMHAPMPLFPEVFNNEFGDRDMYISFGYNFMLWFAAALGFHLMQPGLKGGWIVKSFKGYGVMCLSFVSLALIYMNHYVDAVKPFYFWSAVDAVIVFSVVALANAFLYPRLMPGNSVARKEGE